MALAICEFKVFEEDVTVTLSPPNGTNLALRKPATQSSTVLGGFASRAVDGNRDAMWVGKSCVHTNEYPYHWWQVDLLENHLIGYINIVNRFDCCSWNLKDFVIEISEEDPRTLIEFPLKTNAPVCVSVRDKVPVPGPYTFRCDQPLFGRYVRVVKGGRPINMCEFEVYEAEPTTALPTSPVPYPKNRRLILLYVTSKGSRRAINSLSAQRFATNCGLNFQFKVATAEDTPYVKVDVITGRCQHLRSIADGQDDFSESWVMYKALRR